jgi:hypothetical protein
MVEGRREEQWNHTAAIRADILNSHRDPKRSSAFKPDDLRPATRREQQRQNYGEFGEFKSLMLAQSQDDGA